MYGVRKLTHITYAILRIWLCLKTTKSSMNKAGYVRCATCVITRGVSSIRVLFRALGRASDKTWILRHATFSFLRLSGVVSNKRRGKGEIKNDETCL